MDTTRIVHIHSVIILRHSDKTKDRVEISPEQLSAASIERSAEETGHFLRVVGWYHPCPHDTSSYRCTYPSHVSDDGPRHHRADFCLFHRRQNHKDWSGTALAFNPFKTQRAQNTRELKSQSLLCLISPLGKCASSRQTAEDPVSGRKVCL
ncbi:hypothetical protein ACRRTK_012237 [Alexandromys fortis]